MSSPQSRPEAIVFNFGPYRLDLQDRRLVRGTQVIPLPPKAFDTLALLVSRAGHLVTKEEIFRRVWREACVEENNLAQHISLLRRTLRNGTSGSDFIETVPRIGYRFAATVEPVEFSGSGASPGGGSGIAELPNRETQRQASAVSVDQFRLHEHKRRVRLAGVAMLTLLVPAGMIFLGHARAANAVTRVSAHSKWSHNAEANLWFQRGQFILDRRMPGSGMKGVAALEKAVEKDPNFALAYASLALGYTMNGDPRLARVSARRGVELDPSLAECHAAMGFVAMFDDWDWPQAQRELERAIALDPQYARAHHWYGIWLELHGSFPEAEQELRRALELDPNFPALSRDLAELFYYERRYEEAASQAQRTMDLDPGVNEHGILQAIYIEAKNNTAALAEAVQSASIGKPDQLNGFRQAASQGDLPAILKLQLDLASHPEPSGLYPATRLCWLGQKQDAVNALTAAYNSHDFFMPFIAVDPALDPLRSDPQFLLLLKKIGLPQVVR